jgi:hypothetical protein
MPGSLAFTYCGVPIIYREGEVASVELERADGRLEAVPGAGLSREQSASLFGRVGIYRRLTVTVPTGSFYE